MDAQQIAGEALGLALAARVPVLLTGAPGTGKTSVVHSLAAALHLPCETVIAREPADVGGHPVGSGAGADAAVAFAPPPWARRLAEAEAGLLFFDEITTAPPVVQAALLRVVLDRAVGELTLPDEVAIVAAASPPGGDLIAPLANRFCHVPWPVDGQSLASGFTSGWAVPVPPALPPSWESRIPLMRSWVAGFVSIRPAAALALPADPVGAGAAWPSPRSWDLGARLLAAAEAAGATVDVAAVLIKGVVGEAVGQEFLDWIDAADLPDPEAVLADPDAFVLPLKRDRAYASLTSIAAAVAAVPTRERWANAWHIFGSAADAAPEAAATAARILNTCRPAGAPVPPEVEQLTPLLT